MIFNFLITSFRNIIRHKGISLLNILGLSLSMSVCMLIIVVLFDQFSYDRFHTKKDRIYRVETIDSLSNISLNRFASTAFPLAGELKSKYSGIENVAVFSTPFRGEGVYNETHIAFNGLYANSAVFNIFDFDLRSGNTGHILDEPFTIVLREEIAKKYFGEEDPLGKMFQVDSIGNLKITGIIKESKKKSHIKFEALISVSTLEAIEKAKKRPDITAYNWNSFYHNYVYILLNKETNYKDFQKILDKISTEKYTEKEKTNISFALQPLTKIIPGPLLANEMGAFMPKEFIYFLCGLAFVIILLAVFNYTSLSIARSLLRAKEVGVRKTIGASRKQVILQFLLEACLTSLLALVIAVVLLQFLLPGFTGMKMMSIMEIRPQQNFIVYVWFLIFTLITGLLAGILPAVFISAFQPQHVLKGVLNIRLFSRINLRKILLVTQFAFSMIFIITIILLYRQMNYMINAKMGFDREVVYNVQLKGQNINKVKDLYNQMPEITYCSAASHIPGEGNIWPTDIRINKEDEKTEGHCFSVDENYIPAMGLTLLAGNNFPKNMGTEREKFAIVNEFTVNKFKLGTPSEAIGKYLILDDSTLVEIIGVVKDYKYVALFLNRKSLVLRVKPADYHLAVFRINSTNMRETVKKIKNEWKKIDPYHDLQGDFLDAQIKEFYSIFEDILYTVGYTSLLVIIISSIGLLGMATFSTQTRIKEIAIRKAFGALPANITLLISRSYIWLLLIAALIAAPMAYFANNMWFKFMADHVNFGIGNLVIGIFFVLFIGILTISSQTLKAAKANAAKLLKFE
jgi:putative ABC transport system permease protein